ncbi:MAG: polysaccharide deacetylase family protein [Muribaculaceae bacterium]|nr:polysaccharide deacetylase family protein [Muribaculaceae bacterium]
MIKNTFIAALLFVMVACAPKSSVAESLVLDRDAHGAVVRINPSEKKIFLIFSADSLFQGGETILRILKEENVKGSFFLTGNCLRLKEHEQLIRNIIDGGHYVGGHSDGHILYATWERRDSLIVTKEEIEQDIVRNIQELERFGVSKENSKWFLPPYEYYNRESVDITENLGYHVVNYTPGTVTPADYMSPKERNYKSSQVLIDMLYDFEEANGLNGALLLIHPGPQPDRIDCLYDRLGEIIQHLKSKGYTFESLNQVEL